MFKKHIIFQILYINVGPLCPATIKIGDVLWCDPLFHTHMSLSPHLNSQ